MKTLYKSILSVGALLLAGCNFLDTKIDDDLTPQIVNQNRQMLWYFGNAFYTPMISGYVELDGNFFAAASDEAQRTQASGSTYILNNGTLSPDNITRVTGLYYQYYDGIRAANFFIDFAERKADELLALNRDIIKEQLQYEKEKRNIAWYQAEAHIARAYYYSELLKYFGAVPIIEDILDSDNKPGFAKHSTYDEVVDYIVKEIDDHFDDLQYSWTAHPDGVGTSDGRFDQKAALAIKARTLLYAASPLNNPTDDKGKWEAAAKAAHDVIAYMNYTMPQNRDYGNYFVGNNAAGNAESIFLMRLSPSNAPERANYPISTPGGNSGITPTQNLVESYEYVGVPIANRPYANRDPRLAATVVTEGSIWNGRIINQAPGGTDDMSKAYASKTGYYLKKFLHDEINLTQGTAREHIWVVYRYAEILLIYAEAMNQAFGPDDAQSYTLTAKQALQQVRDAASTDLEPVTTSDPTIFNELVKQERRVELAFEGHRYWDLLRWQDAMTVLNVPIYGVEVNELGVDYDNPRVVANRVFQPRNYRMPFSRSEIENSEGTLTQNTGY